MRKKTKFVLYALIMGLLVLSNGCKNDDTEVDKCKDLDGNVYKTVTIGNQTWMAENLKTTKYNDGSEIPLDEVWNVPVTPAYCWYNNDKATNGNTYGALYNWHAVNTKKLCPIGWHIPSNAEWAVLVDFLGGADLAGGKLKENGTTHWTIPNVGATDEVGFTALPGGMRRWNGESFLNLKTNGNWWASNVGSANTSYQNMKSENTIIQEYAGSVSNGFSVRCISDK
jgi:uncharacterized protein (TIGR02145 family)